MVDILKKMILDSLIKTVPKYQEYRVKIECNIFHKMCSFNTYEIDNIRNSLEFTPDVILSRYLISEFELCLNTDNRFNKLESIIENGNEPIVNLIWDQEFYDIKLKEHEKNMKRKRR